MTPLFLAREIVNQGNRMHVQIALDTPGHKAKEYIVT